MTNKQEFDGRVALVTGGSRGIGRAICLRLAASGAWVAINYSTSADAANQTLALIRSAGGDGAVYQCNVASYEEVDAMFSRIEQDHGPVDLLVANAGIASFKDDRDMSIELWRQILSVNLDGTFHCVWRAKAGMLERNYGRVVCISSINGIAPSTIRPDRLIAYGTSKSAVIGFARNCAVAFGPQMRVNCVAPGLIATDMTSGMSDEMREQIIAATPVRRVGEPADVAELTYFLLSDAASFITGQTYLTSGGLVTLP
ncbi:MAG: 3-oxoacyl-ACP reductase family protein [Burkholderiaceae bacterium]